MGKLLNAAVISLTGMLLALCASVYTSTALAEGGAHPTHVVGLFAGRMDTEKEDDTVIGVEYEYRLSKLLGVGAMFEKAPDAHRGKGETVALVALHVHPIGEWRFSAGAGKARSAGHSKTLYRIGAAYDFPIGSRFAIAPTANVDFVDSHKVYVYGLVFSTHF
jgi:hypothetical protein